MLFAILLGVALANTVASSEHRLPGNILPLQYQLDVIIDLNKEYFLGEVLIKVRCTKSTSDIKLHVKGLAVLGDVSIHEENKLESKQTGRIDWDTHNDFLLINLDRKLKEGGIYLIHIRYKGDLGSKEEGLFKVVYKEDSTDNLRRYAATNVKTRARFFFPCFDEPALRAKFTLKVGHDKNLKAVSNAKVKTITKPSVLDWIATNLLWKTTKFESLMINRPSGSEDSGTLMEWEVPANLVWEEFELSPAMSPHQVSLVVADLKLLEVRGLKMWSLKRIPQNTNNMVNVIIDLVIFYRHYLFVDLPFGKLEVVIIPETTFTTYYGTVIAPEELFLSSESRMSDLTRLAHDIACQWVGGAVSIKWWSDLWYSWALAEHLASLALDKVLQRKGNLANDMFYSRLEAFYTKHMEEEERPVYIEIDRPEQIFDHKCTNAFLNKGPILIRMMHLTMGDTLFQEGMTKFFNKYFGGSASLENLLISLSLIFDIEQQSSSYNMQDIMKGWITQTGFPVVSMRRETGSQEVYVSQSRFQGNNGGNVGKEACWWVPISFISGDQPDTDISIDLTPLQIWLSCDNQEKLLKLPYHEPWKWVMLNVRLSGLYKVKYDNENWKQIGDALRKAVHSNINVLNRVQLIGDALDLAQSGHLDYKTTFEIISYLRDERSHLPWKVALGRLKVITENFFRTRGSPIIKEFLKTLLTPISEELIDGSRASSEMDETTKTIIKWACEVGVDSCNKWSLGLFKAFKARGISKNIKDNQLPKYARRLVYCKGVMAGDATDWQMLKDYFYKCEDDHERRNIVYGLSCSTNINILKSYLEWSVDRMAAVPNNFYVKAFSQVASKEIGYQVAWDFFINNIDKIIRYSPNIDHLRMCFQVLAARADSEQHLLVLTNNMKTYGVPSDNQLEKTFQLSRKRIEWEEKNSETIINAIKEVKFD